MDFLKLDMKRKVGRRLVQNHFIPLNAVAIVVISIVVIARDVAAPVFHDGVLTTFFSLR